MSESEGTGMGRCVAVLAGGRAGGHLAAVLCAVGQFPSEYSENESTCGRLFIPLVCL